MSAGAVVGLLRRVETEIAPATLSKSSTECDECNDAFRDICDNVEESLLGLRIRLLPRVAAEQMLLSVVLHRLRYGVHELCRVSILSSSLNLVSRRKNAPLYVLMLI